jgi:Pretoxin HINT domain
VLARDDEGDAVDWKPVLRTFARPTPSLVRLVIDVADDALELTPDHRLFVVGRGWTTAQSIVPGVDALVDHEGNPRPVRAAESLAADTTVYNLEVEDFHTYFVGRGQLWAHNECAPPAPRPAGPSSGGDSPSTPPVEKPADPVIKYHLEVNRRPLNCGKGHDGLAKGLREVSKALHHALRNPVAEHHHIFLYLTVDGQKLLMGEIGYGPGDNPTDRIHHHERPGNIPGDYPGYDQDGQEIDLTPEQAAALEEFIEAEIKNGGQITGIDGNQYGKIPRTGKTNCQSFVKDFLGLQHELGTVPLKWNGKKFQFEPPVDGPHAS